MKLYLLRHGQTDWNLSWRLQGKTNIPLNEEGRRVARLTGVGMRQLSFDEVISSPLDRAVETAALVLGIEDRYTESVRRSLEELPNQDLSNVFGMPFFTDERIMEMCFGKYEGLSSLNPAYPLEDPDFHLFTDRPELFKAPEGGESCWDVLRRTSVFLMDLQEQAAREHEAGKESRILISGHGAVVRALLTSIEHKGASDFWRDGVPKNCAVSVAESFGEPWRLLEKDRIFYENS